MRAARHIATQHGHVTWEEPRGMNLRCLAGFLHGVSPWLGDIRGLQF
jgi:hypothetical protein